MRAWLSHVVYIALIIEISEYKRVNGYGSTLLERHNTQSLDIVYQESYNSNMSSDYSNRDWEKQPYGVEDGSLFEKFEADLMDELEKAKGVGHILWNTEAVGETGWYEKLMGFEHTRALRKAGDKYFSILGDNVEEELDQDNDETADELLAERKDLAKAVAERYYQYKLRDFTTEARANNFKKLDNMVALVKEARFELYFKLKNWTAGTVRDEIVRLGKVEVEFARGKMAELFGKQTYDDTAQLVEQLKKGIVKVKTNTDGSVTNFAMSEKDNVVTYFTELEKLRTKILQRMDKADQTDFEPCLWPSMVLHARQGLHPTYLRILQNLTMFSKMSGGSTISDASAKVLNIEEDYRRVDYNAYKRACVRQWADNVKIWQKGGNTLPIFSMHGDQAYDSRSQQKTIPCATNPSGEVAERNSCWSCQRTDCRATSDSCALKGTAQQYAFAPAHIKKNYVAGGGGNKTRECRFYLRGTCNHGENCKFAHSGQPSLGSGAVRQPFGKGKGKRGQFGKSKSGKYYKSAESAAKAKVDILYAQAKKASGTTKRKVSDSDEVSKIFLAGVEAANKKQKDSGGTGSSAAVSQPGGIDSQIQDLINQHCMMIRVHEDVRAKVSNKKQKSATKSTLDRISATVLFAGMDDGSSVCLDTGSGVHATSFQRDPIFLNTSEDALEGIGLGGVGGSASLIGRAAFILPLKELLVPNKQGGFISGMIVGWQQGTKSQLCT